MYNAYALITVDFCQLPLYYSINKRVLVITISGLRLYNTQTHRIDYADNSSVTRATLGKDLGYCFPQASKTKETGDHYEKSV